jgi:hypothetical protein
VLVRDPKGRCEPIALLSTDLELEARQSLLYYLRRWSLEATFQAARLHLGIDGQRQWQDLAVARTTPTRLGLFRVGDLDGATSAGLAGPFSAQRAAEKGAADLRRCAGPRTSGAVEAVRFLAVGTCRRRAKIPPAFMRARGGTARLPHLKIGQSGP